MKTEICKFNEHDVTFMLAKDANMMVNATEMAKIFDKYPKDFIILESTKLFILACLKKENSPFLNIEKEEDLIVSKQKSGTWMRRVLALKFAAWLSSDFERYLYVQKQLRHETALRKSLTAESLSGMCELFEK
jgi:hypothetical protein